MYSITIIISIMAQLSSLSTTLTSEDIVESNDREILSNNSNTGRNEMYNKLRSDILGMLDYGQKCLDSSTYKSSRALNQNVAETVDQIRQRNSVSDSETNSTAPVLASLIEQVNHLTEVNNRLTDENIDLQQTLVEYKTRLDTLDQNQTPAAQEMVDGGVEELELLKTQLQIYREDFESERKDRERAQHKLVSVEEELAQVKQRLAAYEEPNHFVSGNTFPSPQQNLGTTRVLSPPEGFRALTSRGVRQADSSLSPKSVENQSAYETDGSSENTRLVGRGLYQTDGPSSRPYDDVDSVRGRYDEEPLQCLVCHREFDESEHSLLLDHMEHCGK